jgi:protein-tyrosine phosphatase
MIDLHAHVLPGVDDGPATVEEAVAMCRSAAADGVGTIVATPHQYHELWENADRDALAGLLATVRDAVGPAPKLLLGAEVRVDSELLAEVDRLPGGTLLTLAGSHYLLLEFPSLRPATSPRHVVHEVLVAGWRPVVAHPERIPWLAEDLEMLFALHERGALLQVTAASVAGRFGRRPQACCEALLGAGAVALVGSDAHNLTTRAPGLSDARRVIAARWGEELAQRLFVDNPAAVLADRTIPPPA